MLRELSVTRSSFKTDLLSTRSTSMVATMTLSTMLADAGAEARRQLADVHELPCPAS